MSSVGRRDLKLNFKFNGKISKDIKLNKDQFYLHQRKNKKIKNNSIPSLQSFNNFHDADTFSKIDPHQSPSEVSTRLHAYFIK